MRLMPFAVAAALVVTACGPHPTEVSSDGEAVRKRAEDAQTARRRTGAEIQQRTLNRVVRTVYLCNNGERLSVDRATDSDLEGGLDCRSRRRPLHHRFR